MIKEAFPSLLFIVAGVLPVCGCARDTNTTAPVRTLSCQYKRITSETATIIAEVQNKSSFAVTSVSIHLEFSGHGMSPQYSSLVFTQTIRPGAQVKLQSTNALPPPLAQIAPPVTLKCETDVVRFANGRVWVYPVAM